MAIKMQIRRGLAAAWASANPTLEPGELGFVTDAGTTAFKIGNGSTAWNSLAYVNSTYPELPVDASFNLNLAFAQGRYPLSSANTYTSTPAIPVAEYVQGATDGNSVLTVTVPSNGIVIQQINTSTTAKQFLRAYNGTTWTSWKRIDRLAAADSLSITNLTLSGSLTVTGQITTLGNMGVGTSSPQQKLDVNGNITSNRISANYAVIGDGAFTFGADTKQYIYGTSGIAGTIGIYASNANGNSVNVLSVNSTGVGVNGSFNAIGINAAASGLTSSGGLTVSNGTTALTVPLVLGTAAGAGTTVFSTKNTSAAVVTTIRGDGVPTATTDLTTKTYVDTAVSAVTFREMMIIAVDNSDTNYNVGGTVVIGVVNNSLSIRIVSNGTSAPGVTFASNLASSTVTWTTGVPSGTRRCLFPSAGTWSVACGVGVSGNGLSFTAIRTA